MCPGMRVEHTTCSFAIAAPPALALSFSDIFSCIRALLLDMDSFLIGLRSAPVMMDKAVCF